MKKRVLTVILCAALLLGAVIVPAYAADRPVYVVLGDSIAFGSGLLNPREAVYGRIVADTDGYEYYNYAVPGHTTGNLLRRMGEKTVREAIVKADIINISIGGNNFLLDNLNGLMYDGIVKKDYSRIDAIAEGVYEDIGTVVDTIRELNPDAAIILQTLYNPQTGYVGEVYLQGPSTRRVPARSSSLTSVRCLRIRAAISRKTGSTPARRATRRSRASSWKRCMRTVSEPKRSR